MVVYVEPSSSVLTMTIGMRAVKSLVEVAVIVEGSPETVVVFSIVTGYTKIRVDPSSVVVTVTVDTLAEPPNVTVFVTWVSSELAWLSAFSTAESGIGAPASSHAN